MAASSYCRHAKLQGIGSSLAFGQKEAAALISQNRRWDMWSERTKSTCPATVFSFPVGRGRMTSYFNLVIYSMVSIESTILIFEIFRKGIAVANKQAPTAKRVASRIDTTGIATS